MARPPHGTRRRPSPALDPRDPAESGEALRRKIAEAEQPVFPVFEPGSDDLVGFVTRRDLLLAALAGGIPPVRELATRAVILPETARTPALRGAAQPSRRRKKLRW